MGVQDWTLVNAGIFHDFHGAWISEIRKSLNQGLLPEGFYALSEQHAGQTIPDILTLHTSSPSLPTARVPRSGGIALEEAPPRVSRHQTLDNLATRRRSIAIRHISDHRLIALLDIVSPANKDRARHVRAFVDKAMSVGAGEWRSSSDRRSLSARPLRPRGIHGQILSQITESAELYDLPSLKPLTLASYAVGPSIEAYVEHIAVGDLLPEMPLFLHDDRYINVPLEATYQQAYSGLPRFWRDVLEGR